ncbi:odorant receptor 49a-like [Halyomorpha halys]|uniref:odorant receptor 49a-like n=1 Tax=Halyomorpha halys TaxID=286706 RepID=UPI0034D38291|nr:Odorant receptor 83 [Halyomorpha halys]
MFPRFSGDKDLADVLRLQKISGFWFHFNEKYVIFLQTLRFLYYVTFFIFANVIAYRIGMKNALSGSYFLVSWGFYGIPQLITYMLYNKKANNVIERLKLLYGKRTEQWQWDMFHKNSKFVWIIIRFNLIAAFLFIVVYYLPPLLNDLFRLIFNAGGENMFSFPYPLKEIQSESRDFKYYGIFFVSLFWTTTTIFYGVGNITFHPIVCSYCCIEIQILRKTLEDGRKKKLLNDKTFLKKIIANHNEILRIVEDAQVVLGPAEGAQIATGGLLLTAFVFALMEIKGNIILLIAHISCLFVMTLLNFSICFFGEMLQLQGDKLFECLCGLPWDEMTPKTRKNFNLILLQARKPICISFKGLLPVNFESFKFMLNTSYSCLMLLTTMKE